MKQRGRSSFLFILFLIAATGCQGSTTSIDRIVNNPRDYDSRDVVVAGEVTEVFSLVFVKYFVVRDNTGEVVVVTERILPKKNTKIKIRGTVQEAFSIGDKQLIVIIEKAGKP